MKNIIVTHYPFNVWKKEILKKYQNRNTVVSIILY